jgi:hypothetical protein
MRTNKGKIDLSFLTPLQHLSSVIAEVLYFCLLAASIIPHQVLAAEKAAQLSAHEGAAATSDIDKQPVAAHRSKRANFEQESVSHQARQVADWAVDSGDNRRMPFVIVDKTDAKVFVFYADGRLRGASPALLGLAIGDYAVPGIGNRKLSTIRPEERTTPAGRFVAALGRNFHGKEILWVDYVGAVSMHPVITTKPKERRAQRLATPTPLDNRISYGCINVPANFFKNVVYPAFTGTDGIVYVLPETIPNSEVFASYVVDESARLQPVSQPSPAQVAYGSFTHNDLIIVGATAEPILGFKEGQVIFTGLTDNRFYYRSGNFWRISLSPNSADPGFDAARGTNGLNSLLIQSLNSCNFFSGGGFCEPRSFLQRLEKVNAK